MGVFVDKLVWKSHRRSTAAEIYAIRLLKASSAAQPKGCSACFVPAPDDLHPWDLVEQSVPLYRQKKDML